jgi:simple sugar transport system ATP-binding protein
VADTDQRIADEMIVAPSSAPDDVLRVEHIAKRFGPTVALRDINMHLRKGEVLGLLGDNGAGKSTLIKIMCGFQRQDSGEMWRKGEPYVPKSVDDARSQGVDTVFQDLALIDELSVYHNLFLRRERVRRPIPFLSNALMRRDARKALDEIGINIPRIDVPAARLSGGQRQAIAVARTISGDADIILLDEPLAAMGAKEGAMILDLIHRLKDEGNVSIIMILHNYVHVLTACDRVNLIQDGVIALDKPTAETSVQELTDIVVEEYRRARMEAALGNGGPAAGNGAATAGNGAGAADSDPAATGNRAADESAASESPAASESSAAPAPPVAGDADDAGDSPRS